MITKEEYTKATRRLEVLIKEMDLGNDVDKELIAVRNIIEEYELINFPINEVINKSNIIGYFVYMFLDVEETALYIGISTNMVSRIEAQHFKSESGNLTKDCILKTHQILYHKAISSDDMKIKERYLINTLNPEYNVKMNNKNRFSFTIEVDWKLYSLDTEKLIEIRNNKVLYSSKKIKNHTNEWEKLEYSWINHGIYLNRLEKDTFLKIVSIETFENHYETKTEKTEKIFALINGEFYVNDYPNLQYYYANYRETSKTHNLNVKEDFLTIAFNSELSHIEKLDSNSEFGNPLIGKTFIKYSIVKKLKLYSIDKINFYDKKLKKLIQI
ncbi:MAG: GIY-YIG nuclease family protein [Paludibacter sp.]|nr:GIY-YIG nuclease family protein [Paludibacter sp.]